MSRVEELPDDYTESEASSESEVSQEEFPMEAARERAEINSVLAEKELRILEGLDQQREYTENEMERISQLESVARKKNSPQEKVLRKRHQDLYKEWVNLVMDSVLQANAIRDRQGRPGFETLQNGGRVRDLETGVVHSSSEPFAPLIGTAPGMRVFRPMSRKPTRKSYISTSSRRGIQASRPRDPDTGRFVRR